MGFEGQAQRDAELVRAAQGGDEAAFSQLVERYFGLVHAVAYARLGRREAAEDLAQEVFLRAYIHLPRLSNGQCFCAWVRQMARNLAVDWARRDQQVSNLVAMVMREKTSHARAGASVPEIRENLDEERQLRSMREIVMRLPVEQREIVLLHYTENLTLREIGVRLGVHRTTVGRQLDVALATLRQWMEPAIRESTRSPGGQHAAIARTIVMVSALGAMSHAARAEVITAAGFGHEAAALSQASATSPGLIGLLQTLFHTFLIGGSSMAKAKTVTAIAAAIVVAGAGLYKWKHAEAEMPGSASPVVAATVASANGPNEQSPSAEAAGVEGSWTATFKDNTGSETAVFTVWKQADGTYAAVVSSDHPDVNRIAADKVEVNGDNIAIEYSQLSAKFKGKLAGSNQMDGELTTRMGETVKGTYKRLPANGPPGPPSATPPSRDELQKFTGAYALKPNIGLKVELDAEGLISTGADKRPTRLIPVSATEFRVGPDPTSIIFVAGAGGVVDHLILRKYIAGKSYDRAMRRVQ